MGYTVWFTKILGGSNSLGITIRSGVGALCGTVGAECPTVE